jgi:hypothetical protein
LVDDENSNSPDHHADWHSAWSTRRTRTDDQPSAIKPIFWITHKKGLIQYTDKKRYWWMLSLFMTVLPLLDIWLYFNFGQEWLLAVPQLENYHFYRWLTWATVPMHFLVLIVIAVFVGTQDLSMISVVVMAIAAGSYSGQGLLGTLVFMFGWVMVPFLLLHNFWRGSN